MEEEETIEDMLKFIESRSIQLKDALEQNKSEEVKDLLRRLRRQNWRLYRRAQREDKSDVIQRTREIAAEIQKIKRNINNSQLCMKYIGMLINLTSSNETIKNIGEIKQDMPKVAVIIPAYNEENYIGRTIESFINQDLPKNEYCIIVVNNNSTDGTTAVVNNYIRSNQVKIYLINESTKGAGAARKAGCNYAIQLKIKYIVNVDSGARYDKNFLKIIKQEFDKDPRLGLIYAQEAYDPIDMEESVERLFRFHGWSRVHSNKIMKDSYKFIEKQWKIGEKWDLERFKFLTEEEYPIEKRIIKGDKGEKVVTKCRGAGSAYRVESYFDGRGFDLSDKTAEDLRLARRIFDSGKWKIKTFSRLYFFESVRRYLPPVDKMINYDGLNCVFIDFGVGYRRQGEGEKHDRIRKAHKKLKKILIDKFLQNRKDVIKYCKTLVKYIFIDSIPDKIKNQSWFKRVFYQDPDIE